MMRAIALLPLFASGMDMSGMDIDMMLRESGEMRLEDWTTRELPGFRHERGFWVNRYQYVSPPVKLKTGEAHFTLNPVTRMPFPKGDYSVIQASWDLVDETETPVGLHEVYNHHWLIGTPTGLDPLVDCEGDIYFGAGAEMRGMITVATPGFGFRRVNAKGYCGANLHFIRTDGLKTKWHGMNDPSQFPPDMQMGAAIKNCIECGYAPNRAVGICGEKGDGGFQCCFTKSRCPVEGGILNRTTKSYHLTYEMHTTDLDAVKPIKMGVIDVSDGAIEWNIAPGLTNRRVNQVCSDTLCNISQTYTVDHQPRMGRNGICPGTMKWGYMHQHGGAISGSMFVNGKHVCTSTPKRGTDPNNAVGNELGYVVGFDTCIDELMKGNEFRFEKGDRVRFEALYDVDVNSNISFPMPGGKHGGVMALFFFFMDCDPGTYITSWVCRNDKCVEAASAKGKFKTLEDCSASCGSLAQIV